MLKFIFEDQNWKVQQRDSIEYWNYFLKICNQTHTFSFYS